MFAKDFDHLNNLYADKILVEMNLGPRGDQDPGAGLSPDNLKQIDMPPTRPCHKCADCGENEEGCEECGQMPNHEDTNASMTKQSLFRLVKLSAMLHDLVCAEQNVEPWVLTKVTEALNHIESVYGYMDYESFRNQVETDIANLKEETENDLYDSINSGGTQIVTSIRDVLSNESKEALEGLLYETITALESKNN
jgi:hypothetical protein